MVHLGGSNRVCYWIWDASVPQGFWVPAPQPELRALPRESLCKTSDPQTLRSRCKVSLKHITSRLAIIFLVPLRDCLGAGAGPHYHLGVSTKPTFLSCPTMGSKNGSSQILGLFKVWVLFKHFWDLTVFLSPTFRDEMLCAFCVRPGQSIVNLETYFSY